MDTAGCFPKSSSWKSPIDQGILCFNLQHSCPYQREDGKFGRIGFQFHPISAQKWSGHNMPLTILLLTRPTTCPESLVRWCFPIRTKNHMTCCLQTNYRLNQLIGVNKLLVEGHGQHLRLGFGQKVAQIPSDTFSLSCAVIFQIAINYDSLLRRKSVSRSWEKARKGIFRDANWERNGGIRVPGNKSLMWKRFWGKCC